MEWFSHEMNANLAHIVGNYVGYLGLAIMVFGVSKGILLFIRRLFDRSILFSHIRLKVGRYLLLSLEFLIAKDLVESIFNPSMETLSTLSIIVVIRTVLSWSLNKEMKEIKKELEEEMAGKTLPRHPLD